LQTFASFCSIYFILFYMCGWLYTYLAVVLFVVILNSCLFIIQENVSVMRQIERDVIDCDLQLMLFSLRLKL